MQEEYKGFTIEYLEHNKSFTADVGGAAHTFKELDVMRAYIDKTLKGKFVKFPAYYVGGFDDVEEVEVVSVIDENDVWIMRGTGRRKVPIKSIRSCTAENKMSVAEIVRCGKERKDLYNKMVLLREGLMPVVLLNEDIPK